MAKIKHMGALADREKEFLKSFNQLTYSRSGWQVWEDLMTVMACSIANAIDRSERHFQKREKEYERAIKDLGGVEVPALMFATVVNALEENPNQDFLGKLYMSLNLGSHWHGQFFTPYHVCELMARLDLGDNCKEEIERKGYISIADCCIGGGAMLIAAANYLREKQVNYHNHVLFVGQDIDPVVAKMAYIQLSLLGCPGYIIIGDALLHPMRGHPLFPIEGEYQDIWYMPFFATDIWEYRRIWNRMDMLMPKAPQIEPHYYFVFNFKEDQDGRKHSISNDSRYA